MVRDVHEAPVLTAVALAFGAAASFSIGSAALQHRSADAPNGRENGLQLVRRLVKRPWWVIGLVFSALAFSMHAAALHFGTLTLVQPVIVSGIVFAVFVRAGLERKLPTRHQVVWSLVTGGGLALFLIALPAAAEQQTEPRYAVWFVVVALLLAGGALAVEWRIHHEERLRGVLLAGIAGLLFGLVAGLLKLLLHELDGGVTHALAHWSLYAMAVIGVTAILVNQRAYQATHLSVTAPVLNIVQVLVALAFGVVVFHERPLESPLSVTGEIIGMIGVLVGVWQLAIQDEETADLAGTTEAKEAEDDAADEAAASDPIGRER